jgi:thioredoxin-like negative regulator of GroEL
MRNIDLNQAPVVVVLFKMEGCPACAEYEPRFRKFAAAYGSCVPTLIVDVTDERYIPLADRLGVTGVPATFVLRRPRGVIRLEGAVSDRQIQGLLDVAARSASCQLD